MLFLQELIFNAFVNIQVHVYFCSVQHVLYTPPNPSTCSRYSANHEATYYDVITCDSLSHTPTHMKLQEIFNCWNISL